MLFAASAWAWLGCEGTIAGSSLDEYTSVPAVPAPADGTAGADGAGFSPAYNVDAGSGGVTGSGVAGLGSSGIDGGAGVNPVSSSGGGAGSVGLAGVSGSAQAGRNSAGGGGAGGVSASTAGRGAEDAGAGGTGGTGGATTAREAGNYTVTGTWPERPIAITQRPGKLVYTKIKVDDRFLAESCSIGDYNRDGIPDISAGRRWYEGPFGSNGATQEHIFRSGHDELPRTGALAELYTGVADDWACYAQDVDGDGYTDIINIACPDIDESTIPNAAARQRPATASWYKNPGASVATTTEAWQAYPLHDDIRGEQHGLGDVDGDGKPEISGACRGCGNPDSSKITRGYYQMDTADPSKPWAYHVVTNPYAWPGGGWLHGFGFGDVNQDGKTDYLERGGVWTNPRASAPDTNAYYNVPLYGGGEDSRLGGSHMFAADVDGDADIDIISADYAHGYGLSWWEQTSPGKFTKHKFAGSPDDNLPVTFSQPHALEVVDMDGDGVVDVITGKTHLAHPEGLEDPDPDLLGEPVNYVFKIKRGVPSAAGSVTFEPHALDTSNAKVGVGRQIAVGHVNTDGIMDVCIASKLGVYVFLGQ